MGSIKGHYEWDDDHLTPGPKKEGGLHQNLFDSEGKLKGSARFIPDNDRDPEPLFVTETIYVPVEQRRTREEEEEFQEAIAELVALLITEGKPLAEQWWRETARPGIDAQRMKRLERRSRRRAKRKVAIAEGTVVEPLYELAEKAEETRLTCRGRRRRLATSRRLLLVRAARSN
jgi:hypothetical protein